MKSKYYYIIDRYSKDIKYRLNVKVVKHKD